MTLWEKLIRYTWKSLVGSGLFIDDFARLYPLEASEMIRSHVAGALETASRLEAGLPDEPIVLMAMFIASMDMQDEPVGANTQPSEDDSPYTILYDIVYNELSRVLHNRMKSVLDAPEMLDIFES